MKKEIVISGKSIEYDLQRKKVKNINIRVKRDLSVRVSAPLGVSSANIESVLREKARFILSALEKYAILEENDKDRGNDKSCAAVFGRKIPISVIKGGKNCAEISEELITVTLKDTDDLILREKTLQKALDELCREEITAICRAVYPKYANLLPHLPEIKFRRMKSRWGSCNYKKQILTFNYALIGAPMRCIEYVVYHEFAHFIHPNHSKEFYSEVSKYVPDYKELKKELEKTTV